MNKMRNVSQTGMEIIENFTNSLEGRNLNPRTLLEYAADLKHFMGWHEYKGMDICENHIVFSINEITISELETYIDAMKNISELKPSTINRRISTIKLFLNWAYHQGFSKRNLAKHLKLLPLEKVAHRIIDCEEEKRLLDAVRAHGSLRDQAILKLMIHTGIRVGEACNILINNVVLHKSSGFLIIESNEIQRSIPLNSICCSILEKYIPSINSAIGYLFLSEKTGEKLTERALRHIIKKYMNISGLEGISAYSFRHNYGYKKAQNTPVHKLAHIMGHERLNTTMTYIKQQKNTN